MIGMWFGKAGKVCAFGIVLFALAGCISTPPRTDLASAPEGVNPASVLALQPVPKLAPYRLQIGDVIDIKMMLNPDLNDEVIVRPDGMISTTVAQDVEAYGHTVKEVREELMEQYREHIKDPQIAVLVRSFAPSRIYVLGEVNAPGEFITVGDNLTMLQSIARAGGFKNSADPNNIVILRRGEGDVPEAYLADYKAAVTGTDPSSDVRLAPYDVVVVPRSDVGDVFLYFQQYLQQFMPATFGLTYDLNPTTVSP